jgi:hypothetical protein
MYEQIVPDGCFSFIQQLPQGQAGKLTVGEQEKHPTVRRRLVTAAKALGINIIIKRSGNDLYFWRENSGEEQPRTKRSYTRRNRRGRAGDYFPPQPFIEPELGEQGVPEEESPELGQLASEGRDVWSRVDEAHFTLLRWLHSLTEGNSRQHLTMGGNLELIFVTGCLAV